MYNKKICVLNCALNISHWFELMMIFIKLKVLVSIITNNTRYPDIISLLYKRSLYPLAIPRLDRKTL